MDTTGLTTVAREADRWTSGAGGSGEEWKELLESGYRVSLCLTGDAGTAATLLELCVRTIREELHGAPADGELRPVFLRRLIGMNAVRRLAAPPATAGIGAALGPDAALAISAVHALPDDLQAVTVLHCAARRTPGEIAAVLGISREAVGQRLRRVRRLLRDGLQDPVQAHPILARTGSAAR
jgi:hypothetical protein